MGCNPVYRPCVDSRKTSVCECDRNKLKVIELTVNTLSKAITHYNKNKEAYDSFMKKHPKHACIFREHVLDSLRNLLLCFRGRCDEEMLSTYCPEQIICNEEYVANLYRYNGWTFKHPDILVIKLSNLTVIIEEKGASVQSRSKLTQQLSESYEYLPEELRSPCTFMVYSPEEGGTLPEGLAKDPQLFLLMKKISKKKKVVFPIPVIVAEKGLLKYL